jgi:hypothetical protein
MASGIIFPEDCKFCGDLIYEDEWNLHINDIVHDRCLKKKRSDEYKLLQQQKEIEWLEKQVKELLKQKGSNQLSWNV